LERTLPNSFLGFRKPRHGAAPRKSELVLDNRHLRERFVLTLRARVLAVSIFLYYFIEQGTIGLFPSKYYIIYRNVRLSDILMYALIFYSLINIREYSHLFKSKSFLIIKILLSYLVFEFVISYIRYDFSPLEYFFRLKGVWSSFLVFPYLLLFKRGGVGFLIKLIFPAAVVSNILYIMTALTGIAFLPDVSILAQSLPGEILIYRVFGGTFFGEFFFLAFVYMWITKRFRLWQFFLVILFALPHILAFGRHAWAFFIFAILCFVILNSLRKKQFKILIRQAILLIMLCTAFIIGFIVFFPEADYYIDAVFVRVTQGQEDVKYNEGTYGTRVIFQSNALVRLWLNSDWILGVGMHPMWVIRAESFEEQVYYNAFCDVSWPGTLAAYGLIGFAIFFLFQFYYMNVTWKLIKKARDANLQLFLLSYLFIQLIFDTFINFTYGFLSAGLWGIPGVMNFLLAAVVVNYENEKSLIPVNENVKFLKENSGITDN